MNLQNYGGKQINNNIMKGKNFRILIPSLIIFTIMLSKLNAQNSSGLCWYLDYDLWVEAEYPDIHGIVPNNSAFNPGDEMTMECWVRSYTFGLNMKIFGMTSSSFNDGYIMGFENMHPYAQIFNPDNQEIPRSGDGPIPQDSAWVHLATSYSSTGQMTNYLNGEIVGTVTVFPQNPIAASSEPFIIGRAPWDFSWAFNGDIDELRIWNVQLSQEEIKENMFRELTGNETGLNVYYNFNSSADENFYDITANGNNGIINNYTEDCFWWAESYAPVGDPQMYNKLDIQGAWFGKSPTQFNFAVSDNGLSVIAEGIHEKEFKKYLIFGHNNLTGTTNENAPANAPDDFLRTQRTWYVNKAGSFDSQVIFNLEDAAGGDSELTSDDDPIYYSLLYRNSESEDFQAIFCSNQINGSYVIFEAYQFTDGYYAIGHSSEQLAEPSALNEINDNNKIKLYPNPTADIINIENAKNSKLKIYTSLGQEKDMIFIDSNIYSINLSGFKPGIYIFSLQYGNKSFSKKIILN